MKHIFTLLILIGLCPVSLGCIISPYKMTIMNSENLRNLSDVIFFGKLVDLKTKEDGKQLANFFVIKSIKGELEWRMEIRNEDLTSCFRVSEPSIVHTIYLPLSHNFQGNMKLQTLHLMALYPLTGQWVKSGDLNKIV